MSKSTDQNWQRVRKIFDEALLYAPEERQKFVAQACGRNKQLRREVESLLTSLDSAESFLETPAVIKIAGDVLLKASQFESGRILAHYEIRKQIGAGGMGEVYLAWDKKLNRRVAIKILRENLLSDDQANRRLLREARAAATLEHPNICAIYEISESDDCSFIVMQYAEGETLADILKKKNLSVKNAIDLAIQITDALIEAHSRGIIHRDIKPANIIVNEKNQAKILDFGLAKFIEAESDVETTERLQSSGAVMGTVPFMSPEQLRGKRLDARTDIFSFGAVFCEMLTGRQVFGRENNAETISAILNDKPDFSFFPVELQPVLQKCLAKNKDLRYESAKNLLEDLRVLKKIENTFENPQISAANGEEDISTLPTETVVTDEPRPKKRQFYFWQSAEAETASETGESDKPRTAETKRIYSFILPFVLVISLLVGAVVLFYWQFKKDDALGNFDALRPVLLVSWKSAASSNDTDYRISHDGKMVAYSSSQADGVENIYVKQTAEGKEIQVTNDKWRNLSPIWSPDDQRIAFVSVRENQPGIYVSPAFGGSASPLLITDKANISLRHWTKDGAAIFYEKAGVLYRLDLATRDSVKITDFEDSPGNNDRYFSLSPDEQRIAFCDKRDGQRDIFTMPTAGGEAVRLTNDKEDEIRPIWHSDGKRILYNVERDGQTQINLVNADANTKPVQVTRGEGIYELIDISPDGTKIYYTTWEKRSDIGIVNIADGEEFEAAAEIGVELWATVSPEGKSIVYQSINSTNPTMNFQKSILYVKRAENRAAPIAQNGYDAHWLSDSRRIAFVRRHEAEKQERLWLVDTLSGEEKQLTNEDIMSFSLSLMPIARAEIKTFDFSPDGTHFVYLDNRKPRNVRLGAVDSPETVSLTNNENASLRYLSPLFSADSKKIVCVSVERPVDKTQKPVWRVWLLENGGQKEIYSDTKGLRLVGWSASGREVIFETSDGPMKSSPININLVQISLNGESRTIKTLENIYIDSMTLAADGKTAAFTARRNDKDDIWTVSIPSGEIRKITANGNTRLFYASLAFAPDGKTILFDKQEQMNTISMFENFK